MIRPASLRRTGKWLESEFRSFSDAAGDSAAAADAGVQRPPGRAMPSFQVTRRYEWEIKSRPLRRLLSALGISNRSLVRRRSTKRTG